MLFEPLLRKVYYRIPAPWRLTARKAFYGLQDIFSDSDGLPPKSLIFTGSGDFRKGGLELVDILLRHGGLRPESKVLDIGSGIGRVAIPLADYLSPEGRYEGFDIMPAGIEWCRRNLAAKHPNFHFTLVDLNNDLYTKGENNATQFVFPYAEGCFDLCFAFSLFTHLLPEETANYLKNTADVLAEEGKCVLTFFTYGTEEVNRRVGSATFNFPYDYGNYRVMDQKVKSANVAYERAFLRRMIADSGLEIQARHPGYWRTGEQTDELSFQDVYVLGKATDQ